MWLIMKVFVLHFVVLLILFGVSPTQAATHNYSFVVKEASYTRLCSTKDILTVNGLFPGPTLHLRQGDTAFVHVHNKGKENITIHWHGILQPRYPWSDGPEFITQCPIMPGNSFIQKVIITEEIGTLWWHAHSDWSRATVHGAIIIYPKRGDRYPFPKPDAEIPIILGEWWKRNITDVVEEFLHNGGDPAKSDAFMINGHPGDFNSCSVVPDTFKLNVTSGKTYLLRMVNAVMNNLMFFGIANHTLTVVGTDGSYTKQLKSGYIAIAPGQTMDVLLEANQKPDHYYMAAKVYTNVTVFPYDQNTTTGIIQYLGEYNATSSPIFPNLPAADDANSTYNFTGSLKSLASPEHPVHVPENVTTNLFFTLSINNVSCEPNNTCTGPAGSRLRASVNNQSLELPQLDILQAYYNQTRGIYDPDFPHFPPFVFNYTANNLPVELRLPNISTQVLVLEYNSTVEIVFQGTNLVTGIDHPMHLHGHSFYVVGSGPQIFDNVTDPQNYNTEDPPFMNTIAVRRNGWTAIRFRANNPGVWFMHCHFERHVSWGMGMTFIVKNGTGPGEQMLPPPPDMPPC
ncbi:laccase-15-like [Coffea arabica]|uniref:Laccase n=1 Tax=Coffea arabica TaxID=13443 RepID=A0ABM4WEG0_COFAR